MATEYWTEKLKVLDACWGQQMGSQRERLWGPEGALTSPSFVPSAVSIMERRPTGTQLASVLTFKLCGAKIPARSTAVCPQASHWGVIPTVPCSSGSQSAQSGQH